MHGDDAHDSETVESVPSDGVAATVYEVIAEPPLYDGAVHATAAAPSAVVDGVAVTPVGWPGVIVTDHLRDRYSSTLRRWLVVGAVPRTTTSPRVPSKPRPRYEVLTLAVPLTALCACCTYSDAPDAEGPPFSAPLVHWPGLTL